MIRLIVLLLLSSTAVFSQTQFTISSTKNQIKWLGNSTVGGGHDGFLKINSGTVVLSASNQIVKGVFEMDMNTIKSIDEKHPTNENKLDGHLKSSDFFDVSRFPKAYFAIEQVKIGTKPNQLMVTGGLTIKGVTNKITFPADIVLEGNNLKVKADFWINRQLWGITYNSPSLFGFAKEAAIANEIKLSLDLIFEKQP